MFGNYMGRRPDPFKNMMVFFPDFMARHSIKPVPGPAGNGLEKFRGKRSKEEERMSVCLSGEEEDVCPMCQGVGSSPSVSGMDAAAGTREIRRRKNYIQNTEKNLCGSNIMFENK